MVSDVAGTDMSDFFRRYVRSVELPPYEEAFAQVGLKFIRESRGPVTVGISPDESEKTRFKIASVRPNSPAAAAGLEEGDLITFFGGTKLTPANLLKTASRYKPGDRVPIVVQRGGKVIRLMITTHHREHRRLTETHRDCPHSHYLAESANSNRLA